MPFDDLCHLVNTGMTMETFRGTWSLYPMLGDREKPLRVLDFACGASRNIIGMMLYSGAWQLTGYDSAGMVQRGVELQRTRLGIDLLNHPRVNYSSEWDVVKNLNFDVVFCDICLQHIQRKTLEEYVEGFKAMAPKILVSGRSWMDDKPHTVWETLIPILGEPVYQHDGSASHGMRIWERTDP